jgi:ribulose-5-phosphate 4-epimerase/fuculose-1-phosphate aldolase
MQEGYIKYKVNWDWSPSMPVRFLKELNLWRDILYEYHLIGAYDNGIGFGNISQRFSKTSQFIITGSGTGKLEKLQANNYSLVIDIDMEENTLDCQGPVIASSESMSHAVIYQERRDIHGIIHVHHKKLWEKLLNKVPTTGKTATYGTPEMAREITRLLKETDAIEKKIIVMEGHEEGIITFGKSLDEAGKTLLEYYRNI